MSCGRVRTWLENGWGFITLGLALIIVAFLLGVVYFSIRAITTSLEHIDIVPTYATALLVCCVGILTLFLYKRRDTMITVPTLVLSIVCLLLTMASFLLLTTKVIRTMQSFRYCQYDDTQHKCLCQTTGADSIVYSDVASCHVIGGDLLRLAHSQCILFVIAFLFTTIATSLISFSIHQDRKSAYLLEEEETFPEPELEVGHANRPRNPLIGRYRQLLSRQIFLPGGRYDMNVQMSHSIRQPSPPPIRHRDEVRDNVNNRHIQEDMEATESLDNHRAAGQQRVNERPHQEGAVGNARNGSCAPHFGRDSRPVGMAADSVGTAPPGPNLLWDGYCRRPEAEVAMLNMCLDNYAASAGNANNPCAFQPILLPPNERRAQSGRSRRRPRPRHRIPHNNHQAQPYVAFVPVPYSMYRPNAFLGVGVSPFPMEPPPPYLTSGQPPPYTQYSPAPAYTSRGTSPIHEGQNNQEASLYETIDI